jgi:alpha-tubulin suppressor-like RCC1 family protein
MRFLEVPALITEDIEDPDIVDITETETVTASINGTTLTINGDLKVSGEVTITLTNDVTVNTVTTSNIRQPSIHKITIKTNGAGNFTYVPNAGVTASSVSTTTKTGSDLDILLITTSGGDTYLDLDVADYVSPAANFSNVVTGFKVSELTSAYGATAKLYKPDGTLLTTVNSAATGSGVNFGYTESSPGDVIYKLEVTDDLGRKSKYNLPRKWINYAMETTSTPGFQKFALEGNEYTSTVTVPSLGSSSTAKVYRTSDHGYMGINFKIQGRNSPSGAWTDIANADENDDVLAFGNYKYQRVWVKPTAKATTTVSSSNVVTLTLSNLTEENVTTSFTGADPYDINESTNTYVFEETTKIGTVPFTVTLGTETYTNAVTATTEGTAYDYVTLAFANPTLSLTTSNVTISSAKLYRDDVLFHTYGTESNVVLRSDQTGTYQAIVNDVYYSNRVTPDFTTTRSVSAPQLEFDGYNRLNLSNITPTSTTLGVPDGTTRDLTTQSNVYIYEPGTYTANVQTSDTFAYLSNVVTSQPSQNSADVGPTFTFDEYNRLAISNLTQTSSTLKYGSNTYDTNTASNVYVTDTGEYKLEARDANTFVMSNVYVGALDTQVDYTNLTSMYYGGAVTDVNGVLYTWGHDGYGDSGRGASDRIPTAITTISDPVSNVWRGTPGYTVAAKTSTDKWYMWGRNTYSAVLGNTTNTGNVTAPEDVTAKVTTYFGDQTVSANKIIKMAMGEHHAVALTAGGKVWSWGGDATYYATGTGTNDNTVLVTPVQLNRSPPISGQTGYEITNTNSAVSTLKIRANGSIFTFNSQTCWYYDRLAGSNNTWYTQQLGYVPSTNTFIEASISGNPDQVYHNKTSSNVTKGSITVPPEGILLSNDPGSWNGAALFANPFTSTSDPLMTGITNVEAVYHGTAALDSSGNVWFWGGASTSMQYAYPTKLLDSSSIPGIVGLRATNKYSLFTWKSDGTFYTRGAGTYGQLATGSETDQYASWQTVTTLQGKTIKKVFGGNENMFVWTDDGVYGVGRGNNYKLGNGSTSNRSTFHKSNTLSALSIKEIDFGHATGLVLTTDGKGYMWGEDASNSMANALSGHQSGAAEATSISALSFSLPLLPTLTFDGYNKLTIDNVDTVETVTIKKDGAAFATTTSNTVYIRNTGTYTAEVKGSGEYAIELSKEVSAINNAPDITITFHYDTFTNSGDPYSDGSVTAAATAGHIFSDTDTTISYTWGTLDSASTANRQTTYTWTPASTVTAKVLMVAGGGGGGNSDNNNGGGGGGGAGGVVYNASVSLSGQQTIVVGGNNNSVTGNGSDTEFTGLTTAIGGGKGGGAGGAGASGGSGGGAFRNGTGSAGTEGQGYAGGDGSSTYSPSIDQGGSGGGGAGGAGAGANDANGANGGVGLDYSSVFGTTYGDSGWFASGGGGGFHSGSPGTASNGGGGNGGGSSGSAGANGQKHTGGGGGGGSIASGTGSYGGTGIVLVQFSPLPSITYDGKNKLTVSGTNYADTSNVTYYSNTYNLGTAKTMYVKDTGEYVFKISGTDKYVESNVYVSSVDLAGATTKPIDFDGYNKLTLIDAGSNVSANVTYFSNTYELGSANVLYINGAGTYDLEMSGSNVFALSSNVVSGSVNSQRNATYKDFTYTETRIKSTWDNYDTTHSPPLDFTFKTGSDFNNSTLIGLGYTEGFNVSRWWIVSSDTHDFATHGTGTSVSHYNWGSDGTVAVNQGTEYAWFTRTIPSTVVDVSGTYKVNLGAQLTFDNYNKLTLENFTTVSDKQWPPADGTLSSFTVTNSDKDAEWTISGASYGNGTYKAKYDKTIHASHHPGQVFDRIENSTSGEFHSASGTDRLGNLSIEYPESFVVDSYEFRDMDNSESGSGTYAPKDFTMEASSDGSTWTVLDTRSGINTWATVPTQKFTVTGNSTAYKHYRISVSDTNGGNYLEIMEMRFYERNTRTAKLTDPNGDTYSLGQTQNDIYIKDQGDYFLEVTNSDQSAVVKTNVGAISEPPVPSTSLQSFTLNDTTYSAVATKVSNGLITWNGPWVYDGTNKWIWTVNGPENYFVEKNLSTGQFRFGHVHPDLVGDSTVLYGDYATPDATTGIVEMPWNSTATSNHANHTYSYCKPPASGGVPTTLTFDGYNKLSIENLTPTSTRLTYGSNTYEIGTASNVYIEDAGTYKVATGDANTFALVSNVVGTVSQHPEDVVPSLTYDTSNKLSIENLTPTSTTLTDPNGSSFDIGTASNVYIRDSGKYSIASKDANTFALASTTVTGTPTGTTYVYDSNTFTTPSQTYDTTKTITVKNVPSTLTDVAGKIYKGSTAYTIHATTSSSNVIIKNTGSYVSVFTTATQAFLTNAIGVTTQPTTTSDDTTIEDEGFIPGSTAVPDETTTDAPSVTLDATDTTVTDPTLDLDFTATLPRTLKRYNGVTNSSIGARFNRHETNKKRIEKSISIPSSFSAELTANNASSPTTLTVTVANSKFVINGDETPTLGFIRGETYTFDQSDASNSGHPLVLATSEDGATQYTTGWTTTPSSPDYVPGVSGAQGTFIVPYDVPDTIYYKCNVHSNMGGEINTTFGNVFSLGDFTVAANTHVSGEYTLATNYDGTTSNLYVNGDLITQITPSPVISAGVKEFILGKEFDGYVKNFKFWNYNFIPPYNRIPGTFQKNGINGNSTLYYLLGARAVEATPWYSTYHMPQSTSKADAFAITSGGTSIANGGVNTSRGTYPTIDPGLSIGPGHEVANSFHFATDMTKVDKIYFLSANGTYGLEFSLQDYADVPAPATGGAEAGGTITITDKFGYTATSIYALKRVSNSEDPWINTGTTHNYTQMFYGDSTGDASGSHMSDNGGFYIYASLI